MAEIIFSMNALLSMVFNLQAVSFLVQEKIQQLNGAEVKAMGLESNHFLFELGNPIQMILNELPYFTITGSRVKGG
jgi:hypothetical protein